jgi:glutamate-1-semialdehyde 2,1-aminomutase
MSAISMHLPNEHDLRLAKERIEGFVPTEIYDIHVHGWKSAHFPNTRYQYLAGHPLLGWQEYRAAIDRVVPGRVVHGLCFGYPEPQADRGVVNAWLAEEVRRNATPLSRALALVSPKDDPTATRALLKREKFVGIKVYHLYAARKDTFNAALEEYAPQWMWEACHEIDGVLMLHIVRDRAIADEGNLASVRRLCAKYPRCRLVLAHVARSFNYRNGTEALRHLADVDNAVVDMSGVTEAEAMREAFRVLGPRRVLYGSDYPVSEMRGRCITTGDSFFWVHPEIIQPEYVPATNFRMTTIGIESLLCLREACEECGLNEGDLKDLFLGNALRLLAPHLPAGTVVKPATGAELWSAVKAKVSGGTGLLSKRAEMFDPRTWPVQFSRCAGSDVWDMEGKRYTDFAGAVGAILLGYADPEVTAAVRRRLNLGTYCTLVSPDEVALAETLLGLNPWAGRVRFGRAGGEALAMAVRIARAATGRSGIAFCGYHGWQDWYLAANLGNDMALDGHLLPGLQPLGVPRELHGTAVPFKYNDLGSFEEAMNRLGGKLAAVVMEPMRSQEPKDRFLEEVGRRCRAAGGIWVVDEVSSGWRFGFPGAMARLGIAPDMMVYAKAMGNGFPCAAILGCEAIMDAANPSFISSSFWTDGVGPAAALACIAKMQRTDTFGHVWKLGGELQAGLRSLAVRHPACKISVGGMPSSPSMAFGLGAAATSAKALMVRGMLARGFIASTQLHVMLAHDSAGAVAYLEALDATLADVSRVAEAGRLEAEAGVSGPGPAFARLA